jgi:hypothetical protein
VFSDSPSGRKKKVTILSNSLNRRQSQADIIEFKNGKQEHEELKEINEVNEIKDNTIEINYKGQIAMKSETKLMENNTVDLVKIENISGHGIRNNRINHAVSIKIDNQDDLLNINNKITKTTRLSDLIKITNKKRDHIEISYMELFAFKYCLCCASDKDTLNNSIVNQLIFNAELEINKKIDTLSILSLFDQFRILKNILLNQNQCFMLDNIGKKVVYNKKINKKKDYTEAFLEMVKKKEKELIAYLKERNDSKELNEIDILLYSTIDEEIKEKIDKEVLIPI